MAMAKLITTFFFISVLPLLSLLASGSTESKKLTRNDFPAGFIFGAGGSAHQTEGAAHIDGKGDNIWDTFAKKFPEKIANHSNADQAVDFYHRYKEDIKLAKEMGLDSYRFSIGWARVLPKGRSSAGVNFKGIRFYNNVINELIANGLKPSVTLLHFDPPQALVDEYGGPLSRKFVEDFVDFANLCFKEFGDRVKHWVTVNEPNIVAQNGYDFGVHAPGRCSYYIGSCPAGNSATEPYIVVHNLLLSHAEAVKLYKEKYQATQKGEIGITILASWFLPHNERSPADRSAASRATTFLIDWIIDPVVFGDYPRLMKSMVGRRLPSFTKEESALLRNSFDFIGVNYYTTNYATPDASYYSRNLSYTTDSRTKCPVDRNGVLIGEPTVLIWLHICPFGLRELLLYMKNKYNNPPMLVDENGMPEANDDTLPLKEALNDTKRLNYLTEHLSYLLQAIKMGANVKGYYVWSYLDNYEWTSGYSVRFGLIFVDFKNNLERYKKRSAEWFQQFLLGSKLNSTSVNVRVEGLRLLYPKSNGQNFHNQGATF